MKKVEEPPPPPPPPPPPDISDIYTKLACKQIKDDKNNVKNDDIIFNISLFDKAYGIAVEHNLNKYDNKTSALLFYPFSVSS